MHDAVAAEVLGVPALAVMTTEFVSAADLMATALGLPGYEYAVIEHPVSSATDCQLEQMAEQVLEACRARLLDA